MKRLFAFGCGFTKCNWTTWAEILAYDLSIPLYNYGHEDFDNRAIFNSVIEADSFFNLTDNDIVVIQWNNSNSVSDRLAMLKSIDAFLKLKNCEYYFISSTKFINDADKKSDQYKKIVTNSLPHLSQIKRSFQEIPFTENRELIDSRFKNKYPSPIEHLNYFEKVFWKINPKTQTSLQKVCLNWIENIRENCSKEKSSLDRYSKEDLSNLKNLSTLQASQNIVRIDQVDKV